ncbi:MAG: hypothetical protein IPL36_03300 [Nigerium sp.]|nr:hypothetical protein [Nigerium sp.]
MESRLGHDEVGRRLLTAMSRVVSELERPMMTGDSGGAYRRMLVVASRRILLMVRRVVGSGSSTESVSRRSTV